MKPLPPLTAGAMACLLAVLACAAGARGWYLATCTELGKREPSLVVQGPRAAGSWHSAVAPLADDEETTAHEAPLYALLVSVLDYWTDSSDSILRWLQCVLGSLTAGCYFLFARRAFHNTFVATLVGLLTAFHPFWILNTAELNDGVLASFIVAVTLTLGARGCQTGDGLTGLAFGLALAATAMTRAALLPFAVVALLWFLWDCRRFPLGWFAAFLALLGFVNGLAPWGIRNWQAFERPVPIATSTYLHLWIGNNSLADGTPLTENKLREPLSEERLNELLAEPNQAKRYQMLAQDVWQEAQAHPVETVARRIQSALVFWFGDAWLKERRFSQVVEREESNDEPPWVRENAELILHATLVGMTFLAFLGWRFSHAWRRQGRIGAIAMVSIPLPYVLSHAETLAGPRLPLDGLLLTYSAVALATVIPGLLSVSKKKAEA